MRVKLGLMSGNKPRKLTFSARRDGVRAFRKATHLFDGLIRVACCFSRGASRFIDLSGNLPN